MKMKIKVSPCKRCRYLKKGYRNVSDDELWFWDEGFDVPKLEVVLEVKEVEELLEKTNGSHKDPAMEYT